MAEKETVKPQRNGEAVQGLGGRVEIGREQRETMNKTHLEHTAIAIAIQLALWPLLGLLAGGIVAIALLLGREIAQHEYKLALDRGWKWGEAKPVQWFEGVTRGWSADSVLDVSVPAVACASAYWLAWIIAQ